MPSCMDINELTDQFAFGIQKHPLAVKNFINYREKYFLSKTRICFPDRSRVCHTRNTVPISTTLMLNSLTWYQHLDFRHQMLCWLLQTAQDPLTIFRSDDLGAVKGTDVEDYLTKLKEYEQMQQTAPIPYAGRGWRKNFMHVTGSIQNLFWKLCSAIIWLFISKLFQIHYLGPM